jgi:hypothetical protein
MLISSSGSPAFQRGKFRFQTSCLELQNTVAARRLSRGAGIDIGAPSSIPMSHDHLTTEAEPGALRVLKMTDAGDLTLRDSVGIQTLLIRVEKRGGLSLSRPFDF